MGEIDLEGVTWTLRKAKSDFYAITIKDFLVGNISIGITDPSVYNDGDAIVDSGTSDCCLPRPALDALKTTLASFCSDRCLKGVCNCESKKALRTTIFENRCVRMSPSDIDAFPDFSVQMGAGESVVHRAKDYLQSGAVYCDNKDMYTISYSNCGPTGSGTILGDSFMQGFITIHDVGNAKIGFKPRDSSEPCPSSL